MTEVRLDNEEWQRVLAILAQAPWQTANPLIMKIGAQLQAAQAGAAGGLDERRPNSGADGKPVGH